MSSQIRDFVPDALFILIVSASLRCTSLDFYFNSVMFAVIKSYWLKIPCFNSDNFLFINLSVFTDFSTGSADPPLKAFFFFSDCGVLDMNSSGGSRNLGTIPSFCRRIKDDYKC